MQVMQSSVPAPACALILEDLPEVCAALSRMLEEAFPGISIQRAASLAAARRLLADGARPDLALIDLALPDGNGVDLIQQLATSQPGCTLVVTTLYADDTYLFPALRAGAQGYLLKDEAPARIAAALRGILDGEPPLSPSIAHRLLRMLKQPVEDTVALTAREKEVLTLVAKGYIVREVAQRMALSPHTVSDHLKRIYRKLKINSRAEAALEAARLGLAASTPP